MAPTMKCCSTGLTIQALCTHEWLRHEMMNGVAPPRAIGDGTSKANFVTKDTEDRLKEVGRHPLTHPNCLGLSESQHGQPGGSLTEAQVSTGQCCREHTALNSCRLGALYGGWVRERRRSFRNCYELLLNAMVFQDCRTEPRRGQMALARAFGKTNFFSPCVSGELRM